ncbi:MAG TPA: NAD(P)/FAD-dependent oxidoreductase [Vicinamibacterales bacterium]
MEKGGDRITMDEAVFIENPYLREGQKAVVIVGAGFGGLNAAKTLAGHDEVHVTIVDQRNHHLFQPLLYQVATAGLSPADIAVPIRSIFRRWRNIAVHLARVTSIDLAGKWVAFGDVRLRYDYLVIACGASHSYFGHNEWEEYAPGLKTLEQAVEIRRRLLRAFEAAENEIDPARMNALLTFVVVGAGPTGVELAGAIADISRTVLLKDFRRIDPKRARILLVEAGPRVLPAFPPDLSARAARDLRDLGVEVRTGAPVTRIDADGVVVGDERIEAKTVLWAAGVQANPLARTLGLPLDRAGRISVEPDLSLPGAPDAFAVGDIVHLELPDGTLLPGLAPAAIQTGETAARNILASVRGQPREVFRYRDKGLMATIGKRKAVARTGRIKLTGFIAWLAWLFVHLLYLVGFKNRVSVLGQWVWSYLFSQRGARLITEHEWRLDSVPATVAVARAASTASAAPPPPAGASHRASGA